MQPRAKTLKKLLTTSSVIAILTANISPSFAGAQDSLSAPTGNPNSFNNTNDWLVGGAQNVATPNNNPLSMVFFGQAQNMNLDNVIGNIGTLNLYGFDGQTFNITAPNSIEGIISDVSGGMIANVTTAGGAPLAEGGAGAGAKVNLNVNIVNDTLELVTDQLGALGNTTLVSSNTNLKLSGDNSVIDGTIDGGSPGNGKVEVNANNVTFNGVIGGTLKINGLRIQNNKSATLNADSSYLGNDGLTIAQTAVLTLTAGKTVDASGASINFTNADSTLVVNGNIDTTLRGPFNAHVVSGGIIKANGLTAGKTLTLIDRIGNNNNPLALIEVKGGGNLKLRSLQGEAHNITKVDMSGGDGNLILIGGDNFFDLIHDNNKITIIISDEGVGNNDAATTGIIGNISSAANPLKKILFTNTPGGAIVNVFGIRGPTEIYAGSIETDTAQRGVLLFDKGPIIVDSPIGTKAMPLVAMAINENTTVEFTQNIYLKQNITLPGITIPPFEIGLGPGAKIRLRSEIVVGDIMGLDTILNPDHHPTTNGTVEFINATPTQIDGNISSINTVSVQNSNVSITGDFEAQTTNFTNSVVPSTLTIGGEGSIGTGGASSSGNGIHNIIFEGNATVLGDIGSPSHKFANIIFASDPAKTTNLGANIYANAINTDNANLTISNNIITQSNFSGSNITFNLGSHTLTTQGKNTFTSNVTFNTTAAGNNIGNIVADGAGSKFDFSGVAHAIVKLTATTPVLPVGATRQYSLFSTTNNGLVLSVANVDFSYTDTNPFIRWSYDPATFIISLVNTQTISGAAAVGGGNSHDLAIANALSDPSATGNAAAVQLEFNKMTPAEVAEAIARLEPAENTFEAEAANVQNVETEITNRVSIAALLLHPFVSVESQGVAAGDGEEEIFRHGFWASSFYSKARQKQYSINPGYKTSSGGATVGYDTMVNDDLMLGAAFSVVASEIKAQDQKAGDRAKADTMMLSLYGLQEFRNDWFVQGIASIGSSEVRNHEQRNITGVLTGALSLQADSKYNSMTYNMQAIAGHYYHLTPAITVTPMAGMRYERFNSTSYQETGAGIQNLWIKRKASDMIEAIVGARVTMETEVNQVKIIPQLYGFGNFDLKGKPTSTEIRIEGLSAPLPDKAQRPTRRWYNLGAGLAIKYGKMEYGAIYEAQLDKKYIAHQGILKIRINF